MEFLSAYNILSNIVSSNTGGGVGTGGGGGRGGTGAGFTKGVLS